MKQGILPLLLMPIVGAGGDDFAVVSGNRRAWSRQGRRRWTGGAMDGDGTRLESWDEIWERISDSRRRSSAGAREMAEARSSEAGRVVRSLWTELNRRRGRVDARRGGTGETVAEQRISTRNRGFTSRRRSGDRSYGRADLGGWRSAWGRRGDVRRLVTIRPADRRQRGREFSTWVERAGLRWQEQRARRGEEEERRREGDIRFNGTRNYFIASIQSSKSIKYIKVYILIDGSSIF